VLIEAITAAFEMEEILWELREHAAGLNAGRWDYIFSIIKKFRSRADFILPDRRAVTMGVPFMRAYTELLVSTCHRRGAHAMGGMAAFIPSRRDAAANERAMTAVQADKERESGDGFDGTWVAHPDLVPLAAEVFGAVLGDRPNQKGRVRDDVVVEPADLLDVRVPDGAVTEAGVRANVSIGLAYMASWLAGNGAASIRNLMEDAATAEISRSQLWQWRVHAVRLDDGSLLTADRYRAIRDEELAGLRSTLPEHPWSAAGALLDDLVLSDDFAEFLTLAAYPRLVGTEEDAQ
jgi:malate synthase